MSGNKKIFSIVMYLSAFLFVFVNIVNNLDLYSSQLYKGECRSTVTVNILSKFDSYLNGIRLNNYNDITGECYIWSKTMLIDQNDIEDIVIKPYDIFDFSGGKDVLYVCWLFQLIHYICTIFIVLVINYKKMKRLLLN